MLLRLLGQKSIDVRDDAALCSEEHGESKCNTQRGIHIGEIRIFLKSKNLAQELIFIMPSTARSRYDGNFE